MNRHTNALWRSGRTRNMHAQKEYYKLALATRWAHVTDVAVPLADMRLDSRCRRRRRRNRTRAEFRTKTCRVTVAER